MMKPLKAATLSCLLLLTYTTATTNLSDCAHDLLTQSMKFMDHLYDPEAGYMYAFNSALLHETRSSSWYAAGLLARNENDDVKQAIKILQNIIAPQFISASEQWYGDYQSYPEQPYPGTEQYPAVIYNSWDPNWRGFIGTAFIVCLEEYSTLLPAWLQTSMISSLHLNALGDAYRVGGVDDDNLYPFYSNAAIMKAAVSGWIGRRRDDANLTAQGEHWGQQIIDLFDHVGGSLSEFNSPTYTGISLFALTLWAKYLPSNSTLRAHGPRMIKQTWEQFGQLYNANLRQLSGPWDRAYGYDESRYVSVTAQWVWSFVGSNASPFGKRFKPWAIAHNDDFEFGPLVAILSQYHIDSGLLSDQVLRSMTEFDDPGEEGRFFEASAFSDAYDYVPRNITSWISANLTIGSQSFDMNVAGGPARNLERFNPAVVQWLSQDGNVGFLTLYPDMKTLQTVVSKGRLNLTLPNGNHTSKFVFHVSPNGLDGPKNVYSWDDMLGINVKISGTVTPEPSISFCGRSGGACAQINEFDLWEFIYSMPAESTDAPNIILDFELK